MERGTRSLLANKARKGFRGYPVATVAYYGHDAKRASKVTVAIIRSDGAEPTDLERWLSDVSDVRTDTSINEAIVAFVRTHGARTVIMTDRIIGCPHEEGVDYPDGEVCPRCPHWANRDRWSGEALS